MREKRTSLIIGGHYRYDAFGNRLQGDDTLTRYLYTGREYDVDTKLQYNRNRWYDSKTGRWLSEDPIGFAGGDYNLYRYVGNDPTNHTDPSGTTWYNPFSWPWGDWSNAMWPIFNDATGEPVGTIAGTGEVVGEMMQSENIINYLKYRRDHEVINSACWKEWNDRLKKAEKMIEDAKHTK